MGMSGSFSHPSLLALLESGVDVCAVVLPARVNDASLPSMGRLEPPVKARAMLPVLSSSLHTTITRIAWERSIPVWEVQRMSDPETRAVYASYMPDAYCVACFSLYIPRNILDIPRLGCLNVHPSLLPANRGPDPLFWTFRNGDEQTGVTIHLMDEGLDTGPIVAQERIDVPDGIRYVELEAQCAELGGRLLARSLWERYCGTARLTPQDESQSSYLPMPTTDEYVVPVAAWTARRVYNFVRGVATKEHPVTLLVDGRELRVANAISYSHKDTDSNSSDLIVESSAEKDTRVMCEDGWVRVL
jgi:methionyl-tRNA formyltransferase